MIKNISKRIRIPFILLLVFVPLILTAVLTSSPNRLSRSGKRSDRGISAAVNDTSVSATTGCITETTSPYTSAASTTTTTTTTVCLTTAAATVTTGSSALTPDRCVGTSPNSTFYQERMFTAGDSVTLGLKYYGFIPREHSIAGDSVSMWNLGHFTFNIDNEELELVDAIEKCRPKLLYIWIGMNDVNLNSPDRFVKRYREVIDEITERIPDINMVVAAITPVSSGCKVVKNSIIRDYNAALIEMVKRIDSPNVYFFDAYSVICDEKLCLRDGYSSGDGLHLYIPCYTDILTALFDYLDTTDIKEKIE